VEGERNRNQKGRVALRIWEMMPLVSSLSGESFLVKVGNLN